MFPVSASIVVIYLIAYGLAGMALGAFSGWLTTLVTKCDARELIKDALLGSLGYLAGLIGCALTPWPTNTVSYFHHGTLIETSTMNRYQHPHAVGIFAAILLPLVHELYRFRRAHQPNRLAQAADRSGRA